MKKILETQASWGITLVRITLGYLFIREGAGKLLGWFDGTGFISTCVAFAEKGIPLPAFNTWLVATVELWGGLVLLFGFLSRVAAAPLAVLLVMEIIVSGKTGTAACYSLLLAATCLAVFQQGSGPFSLDRFFLRKKG